MRFDSTALEETVETLARRLLSMRNSAGYWEGELASSALSTATAVAALAQAKRLPPGHERLVRDGLSWLGRNRNPDGGWGDTVKSKSNISTTALCWASIALAGGESDGAAHAAAGAETWLRRAAGSIEAERLAESI